MILMTIIPIFSILGMNLFGCKFCDKEKEGASGTCDRKNFDSLLWALVTVFQVLEFLFLFMRLILHFPLFNPCFFLFPLTLVQFLKKFMRLHHGRVS